MLDRVKVVGAYFVIVWFTAGCETKCPHGIIKLTLTLSSRLLKLTFLRGYFNPIFVYVR